MRRDVGCLQKDAWGDRRWGEVRVMGTDRVLLGRPGRVGRRAVEPLAVGEAGSRDADIAVDAAFAESHRSAARPGREADAALADV